MESLILGKGKHFTRHHGRVRRRDPRPGYDYLYQNGAAAIFGPGTVIPDSARKILKLLLEQLG
jgi:methylmalonyl-CoA mutase cobalamin-binding subunit